MGGNDDDGYSLYIIKIVILNPTIFSTDEGGN
jgi:hypothetical protein